MSIFRWRSCGASSFNKNCRTALMFGAIAWTAWSLPSPSLAFEARLENGTPVAAPAPDVSAGDRKPKPTSQPKPKLPRGQARDFGSPPKIPTGGLDAPLATAVDQLFVDGLVERRWGDEQLAAITVITKSRDLRLGWLVADLMRVMHDPEKFERLRRLASTLLGRDFEPADAWGDATDLLMAWDVPAPPDYLTYKRRIYTRIEPKWERIFADGDIDWRHVSWGGVLIDDRPWDKTDRRCNCIPAADNPPVTSASEADWLSDDDIVFGVEIGGAFRAYPRRIMEVREMVNDSLGGRDFAMPYCTLCGSAQVFFTDGLPEGIERPVLRTSGLLIRSNKVMFDIQTYSVFDTFRGVAVTGPLAKKGIALEQASVVTTSWGAWKAAHPETTVLREELALGRDFDFRNGRDANGPIFPIGSVDPRLAVQEDVVGVITSGGTPVAFHVDSVRAALRRGEKVALLGVRAELDGDGVRLLDENGKRLAGHQAFWFAWSQFHPRTRLWPES